METYTAQVVHKGKKEVPAALQVIGILCALSGVPFVLFGIPLILALGFGFILIAFGLALIHVGLQIFRGKKSAYVKGLVLGILLTFWGFAHFIVGGVFPLVFLGVIYSYRESFVN